MRNFQAKDKISGTWSFLVYSVVALLANHIGACFDCMQVNHPCGQ